MEVHHGPGDTLFAVRETYGPCAQLQRTHELKCVFCDRLDPMEMAEPHKWADGPLAFPISEPVP